MQKAFKEFAGDEEVMLCANAGTGFYDGDYRIDDFELAFQQALVGNIDSTTVTASEGRTVPNESRSLSLTSSSVSSVLASPLFQSCGLIKFEEDPLSALYNHHVSTMENASVDEYRAMAHEISPSSSLSSSLSSSHILREPKKRGRRPKSVQLPGTVRPDRLFQIKPRRTRLEMAQSGEPVKPGSLSNEPSITTFRHKRFPEDEYTPSWIRGSGAAREGLCPHCTPQLWLRIKQSAYWYHLNFFHGICATTGRAYVQPDDLRIAQLFDEDLSRSGTGKRAFLVEAHCVTCSQWITLLRDFVTFNDSGCGELTAEEFRRQFGMSSWYKHAQKCHSRPTPNQSFQL